MKILLQAFSFLENNGNYCLAILFLRSALRTRERLAAETEVRVVQSDYFADLEQVHRSIEEYAPDLVGFSVFGWSKDLTEALLDRCAALPRTPTILCGGTGLHSREVAFLRGNPQVAAVVHGAGEQAFIDLVEHYLDHPRSRELGHVPGITFRAEDGEIRSNQPRQANLPLARLPTAALGTQ